MELMVPIENQRRYVLFMSRSTTYIEGRDPAQEGFAAGSRLPSTTDHLQAIFR